MSQTAAQINQEILDRLNRPGELGADAIYNYMNRTKRRCQLQGSPLDFMFHEQLVLLGSGATIPNQPAQNMRAAPFFFALAPNFHTLVYARIYTGAVLSFEDVTLIYGDQFAPSLFYYPSTCTVGSGLSTEYTGGNDLYPLFNNDSEAVGDDMEDRGVTVSMDDVVTQWLDCRIVSQQAQPFVTQPINRSAAPIVRVDSDVFAENPNRQRVATEMGVSGYAMGPWSGKILTIPNYEKVFGVESPPNYRFMQIGYYRTMPDYNEPSMENRLVPVPTEDMFTRTGEDLLVTGSLRLAYRYLNQFDQAEKYQIFELQEQKEFRRTYKGAQNQANYDEQRRVGDGVRIVRAV